MIGMTERLMPLMSLIALFLQEQYPRMRYLLFQVVVCYKMSLFSNIKHGFHQVITQIWVLLLGGLGLAGLLDVWVGLRIGFFSLTCYFNFFL